MWYGDGSANRRENMRKGYERALHSIGIFYNHCAFGSTGRYYDGAWLELLGYVCDYRWNHLFVGKIFTGKYRITEMGEYLPVEVVPEYYNKECVTNFDQLVIDAINELPQNLKDRLSNVSVVVEDKPSSSVLGKLKLLPNTMLMGLFQGIPLNKKSVWHSGTLPEKITVYQKNIEAICRSEEEIKRRIINVVRHEVAHYVGFTEEEIRKMGY